MGQASRRVREPKDPLRWLRATIEAKTARMEQAAQFYHYCRAEVDMLTAKLAQSEGALRAEGHPLYQEGQPAPEAPSLDGMLLPVAPETAPAPEAAASEETHEAQE